jgi:hypothetical protein
MSSPATISPDKLARLMVPGYHRRNAQLARQQGKVVTDIAANETNTGAGHGTGVGEAFGSG